MMSRKDAGARLETAAERAIEMLEDLVEIMQTAADRIADGAPVEEIDVRGYPLYVARPEDPDEGAGDEAVICPWCADDYFDLLSRAASVAGISLEDSAELMVRQPETEFEENMVTGWFHAWRGIKVELKNEAMDDLVGLVGDLLRKRGLFIITSDEDVIFCIPVRRKAVRRNGQNGRDGQMGQEDVWNEG